MAEGRRIAASPLFGRLRPQRALGGDPAHRSRFPVARLLVPDDVERLADAERRADDALLLAIAAREGGDGLLRGEVGTEGRHEGGAELRAAAGEVEGVVVVRPGGGLVGGLGRHFLVAS